MSSLAAVGADGYYHAVDDSRRRQRRAGDGAGGKAKGGGTVRFEMPEDAACAACGAACGRGVRFNARKERAGAYLSSPIWQFTMKATCCGATFVVRTDPQSAGFVFVSGGRFRHTRRNAPVRAEEGDYWAGTDERAAERAERERAQLRQGRREGERTTGGDAMATLERAQEDERIAKAATKRMDELYSAAVPFGDDYASNAALRRDMRARRKAEKALESEGRQMGVGVPLLARDPSDAAAASAVAFGSGGARENAKLRRRQALGRPVLPGRARAAAARGGAGAPLGAAGGVAKGRGTAKDVARSAVLDAIRKARRAT